MGVALFPLFLSIPCFFFKVLLAFQLAVFVIGQVLFMIQRGIFKKLQVCFLLKPDFLDKALVLFLFTFDIFRLEYDINQSLSLIFVNGKQALNDSLGVYATCR